VRDAAASAAAFVFGLGGVASRGFHRDRQTGLAVGYPFGKRISAVGLRGVEMCQLRSWQNTPERPDHVTSIDDNTR